MLANREKSGYAVQRTIEIQLEEGNICGAVVQRVSSASVTVAGRQTGTIDAGLLVLLGVHGVDEHKDITWLANKVINLRIFDDEAGLMNRSLLEPGGAMLIVSQFTLLGDCRKGRRPVTPEVAGSSPVGPASNIRELP